MLGDIAELALHIGALEGLQALVAVQVLEAPQVLQARAVSRLGGQAVRV